MEKVGKENLKRKEREITKKAQPKRPPRSPCNLP